MAFNAYSAGARHYGGGRSAPNIGPSNPLGYRTRDLKIKTKNNAILRRMRSMQSGNVYNPAALRSLG